MNFIRSRGSPLLLILGAVAVFAVQRVSADPPFLAPPDELSTRSIEEIAVNFEMLALNSAIEAGFLRNASALLNRLRNRELPAHIRDQLSAIELKLALISGQTSTARSALIAIQDQGIEIDPVLSAFAEFFVGDKQTAKSVLEDLDLENLSQSDRAWTAFLQALILKYEGANDFANEWFLRAERLATVGALRDHFEMIRLRSELSAGQPSLSSISALRETARSMRGERAGYEAARLLAIALNMRGEIEEALSILNSQLASGGLRAFGLRADFLLLVGVIAGPESTRGRLALTQLLSEAGQPSVQSVALTLLAQSVNQSEQLNVFIQDLRTWLDLQPPHPLADRILAYLTELLATRGDFEEAERNANRLLTQYPDSPFVGSALRTLAYISWNRSPPQYRTAADFLNRLRQTMPDGEDKLQVAILIGDCFFLNGDFTNASDAYGSAMRMADVPNSGSLLFRRIYAEIQADRLDVATSLLDQTAIRSSLDPLFVWKAEWNLILALRKDGQTVVAFNRLEQLLNGSGSQQPVDAQLLLRLRWLQSRMLYESGDLSEAVEKAQLLLSELSGDTFAGIDQELGDLLRGHLMLLSGEAMFALGQAEEAQEIFSTLRERFPDAAPTMLSYLVESRNAAEGDTITTAQRSLIDLVNRFPQSDFAPIALWEAALHAEQRGLNVHLQEAISTLERLVVSYPDHPLVFYARLKQGDIARRLNDFPTAVLLYERALNQFPLHPERFRAELSRADGLLALGTENPSHRDTAIAIYERNTLLATIPPVVRLEAGYKWARALSRQNDRQGASATYWLVYASLINNPNLNPRIFADASGRYWAARTLLDIAESLISAGEIARAASILEQHLSWKLPASEFAKERLRAIS